MTTITPSGKHDGILLDLHHTDKLRGPGFEPINSGTPTRGVRALLRLPRYFTAGPSLPCAHECWAQRPPWHTDDIYSVPGTAWPAGAIFHQQRLSSAAMA